MPVQLPRSDHPRACGANLSCHIVVFSAAGSSPRVRGKRRQNTGAPELGTDHPRACGANVGLSAPPTTRPGSSPRVRGKLKSIAIVFVLLRIIPARAGQTCGLVRLGGRPSDHPRACGANVCCMVPMSVPIGSSPRVRGKHLQITKIMQLRRIIPARAGQTAGACRRSVSRTDHPRACGANGSMPYSRHAHFGSSPRVRGKLC